MRIRRGLLFAGLFLIPVGAITLLVRAGTMDADAFADIWRLWPLILIGFGIAILLGRSRVASVGTAIAALVLGVMVGGAIASGGSWIGNFTDCGPATTDAQQLSRTGDFTGPATLDLDLRCGSVTVSTTPDDAWQLHVAYNGVTPLVTEAPDRLAVHVPEGSGVRHNDWTIRAPRDRLSVVRLQANAATGSLTLAGASLRRVALQANAGDVLVDGSEAEIDDIDVDLNAGRARVTLAGTVTGRLQVNAGAIDLCLPPDANLRLTVREQLTFATNLDDRGLTKSGTTWTRTAATDAPTIDLRIEGNAASFTLDPEGGCR